MNKNNFKNCLEKIFKKILRNCHDLLNSLRVCVNNENSSEYLT